MALVGSIVTVRCPQSDGALALRRWSRRTCGVRCTAAPKVEEAQEVEKVGPVLRFATSDFKISSHVSLGLQGRTDEVIYEATVCDPNHVLYNSRVVLRQLTSVQAKRRGRRALEVLKKLARRQLMYDSYAMQVHGYLCHNENEDNEDNDNNDGPFTLVHGYHGSYSLRHWLQLSNWLPTLEATLALNEEQVRRVGDDSIGGPAVTRQLRLTRVLMRDLLIGVNYLHSQGLAHTELRLENVHISPVDKHVKVGILGNAVDFYEKSQSENKLENNIDRRKLMIAFDIRCVGFIMAKLVLRELMDTKFFSDFKSFLTKGNDPSCLREFLLPILSRNSPSGNIGLQMLDRNWGAGWNLLSLLLATKPSERISCLDALRHPFLCGPRWRVNPSIDIIRWGLGSTIVRMAEDYIYGHYQRKRIADFIELMELLNPNSDPKNWTNLLPGKWRLLYCTGKHIGLTLRTPSIRALITNTFLSFKKTKKFNILSISSFPVLSISSDITFTCINTPNWPHNKSGMQGSIQINSCSQITPGKFEKKIIDSNYGKFYKLSDTDTDTDSLSIVKFNTDEIEISMTGLNLKDAEKVLNEVRIQIPKEIFDLSRIVCGSYLDSRILVLRGVDGSALFFTRCGV